MRSACSHSLRWPQTWLFGNKKRSGSGRGLQLRLELLLQALAGRAFGERVDELDDARVFVGGEPFLDESDDFGLAGLGARLQRHDRLDLLAEALVRDADHGRLGHRRVGIDDLFDLARVYVEPAAEDHLLLAIDDEEIALLVDVPEVSGVEPAALESLGGRLWIPPVALHHVVASDHDLPHVVLACRQHLALLVNDLELDPEHRLSDTEYLALRDALVERRRRRRLGEAVALEDGRPELLLERLKDLARERCAPGAADAQGRGVVLVCVRVAPTWMATFMTEVWPKEWNIGSTHRNTSSSVLSKTWLMKWQFMNRLECVISAPFGLPVVPDV